MSLQKGKHTPGTHNNHQPRVQYTNSRIQSAIPGAHLSQVQRVEEYQRQGSGFQQGQAGQSYRNYTALASVSVPPHDMSKQGALQTQAQNTGLYACPTPPGVAGPGNPQTPPSAMSTQVPNSHHPGNPRPPNQVVQQQPPRNQMTILYQQQQQQSRSILRPMHPTAHWAGNPMNPQQSQHGQYNMTTSWLPQNSHFQPLQFLRSPPAPVMTQYPTQVAAGQFSPTAHAQYSLSAGQQQMGYPQAAPYYGSMAHGFNPVFNPQNRASVQNATPQPPQQNKKIITIQDPDTFADVTQETLYGDRMNSNQSEQTQHQTSKAVLEFAAMVASVASKSPSVNSEMDPLKAPDQGQVVASGMVVPQQVVEPPIPTEAMMESMDVYARRAVLEDSVPVYELGQPIDMSMEETQMSVQSLDINDMCEMNHVVPGELGPVSVEPIIPPALMADGPSTNIESEISYPLDVVDSAPSETYVTSFDPMQSEVLDVNEYPMEDRTSESVSMYDNASSERVPLREQSVEKVEVVTFETIEVDPETGLKPQQNGDIREGLSPGADGKDSAEARDSKKLSRARKMKELNMKGESKEGSEMDAFVDKETETAKLVSPPPAVVTSSLGGDQDEKDKEEEERKVAEKNEENKRYSQEVETESTPLIETPTPQLPKYQYKEDQWSPLNPEGKKHYDRAFLIMLQSEPMSLQKPLGLPNLEVIRDRAIQHNFDQTRSNLPITPQVIQNRSQHDMFVPHFARSGTPRHTQGGINRRQSQQGGREKPKKIISSSFTDDVKLHAASNAWKPTRKVSDGEPGVEEAKTQDLYKRFRGILNKLTPQKFQTLIEQVKDLPIDTEARLTGVIDLVFEKAVDEPNFSVPYANMCKDLVKKQVPSEDGTNVNFRKLLLTKCQREFERDKNDTYKVEKMKEIEQADTDEKKQKLKEELDEEERKARRRSLGNIRFIGELFKLQMLTAHIMHDCLKKLLLERDEESLECLCRLLTTIGKELEDKSKPEKGDKHPMKPMDSYFDTMRKIINERQTSSRVRFMLQDVIDLRARYWVPRREDNNPKTIDQIHLEAEREVLQTQALLAQQVLTGGMNKRMDDRDRRKNRGGHNEEGWNMVGSNKGRGSSSFSSTYDSNKLPPKIISRPLETEIQLGPGSRTTNWSKGSSGGGTKNISTDADSRPQPTNRFQALQEQNQSEPKRIPSRDLTPPIYKSSSSARREPSAGRTGSQGPSAAPIRKTNSQMATREKEQALAAVMALNLASEPAPLKPLSLPVKAKEVESKDFSGTPVGEYLMTGKELSLDDMDAKVKPSLDEFLHTSDFEEMIRCTLELVTPSTIHLFLHTSINHVLERSSQALSLVGQLFRKLVDKNILNLAQYSEGIISILDIAEDLEIDIPKIWGCLGEIIAPMVQDGAISMSFLERVLNPNINSKIAGKVIAALLHVMANNLGPKRVHELFHNANLKIGAFLFSDQDEAKFIATNELEFIIHEVDRKVWPKITPEEVQVKLSSLLSVPDVKNEQVFEWIEANVGDEQIRTPQYVRALVTAVTGCAIEENEIINVNQNAIKERHIILQKYLDNKESLELQALYAIQALIHRLEHPKGMLTSIFNVLYDEDVISEDAFSQWEKSTDPAEQEGKGVALKSATSFFTWLKEADEDSAGNE